MAVSRATGESVRHSMMPWVRRDPAIFTVYNGIDVASFVRRPAAFLALNRPGAITLIQGSGVGLGLLMMQLLMSRFGAAGAPLALLASSVIRLVATLFAFRPVLGVVAPRLVPTASDGNFISRHVRGFAVPRRSLAEETN